MEELLIRWIELLKKKGINSKKIVRQEMEAYRRILHKNDHDKDERDEFGYNEDEYWLELWESMENEK